MLYSRHPRTVQISKFTLHKLLQLVLIKIKQLTEKQLLKKSKRFAYIMPFISANKWFSPDDTKIRVHAPRLKKLSLGISRYLLALNARFQRAFQNKPRLRVYRWTAHSLMFLTCRILHAHSESTSIDTRTKTRCKNKRRPSWI